MKPLRINLGLMSAVALMAMTVGACSSSENSSAQNGSTYGTAGADQSAANTHRTTQPQQPTQPQKAISAPSISSSNKTKDALGHKPGPKNFSTVIIDAGHGGKDSGAVVNGVTEKTLALDVARKLRDKLRGQFKSVFIRSGDYFVDLDDRVSATHKFDDAVLVSIHLNHSTSSSVRGPETYYFRVDSYSIAKRMQLAMSAVSSHEKSRGLVRRRLRLTRNPQIPCVLVELGYLSNSSERNQLSQAGYRDKMASALASALIAQKRNGDAGMGKLPEPLNRPLSRPTDTSGL